MFFSGKSMKRRKKPSRWVAHLFSLALAFAAAQQSRFLGLQWQLFAWNRALLIFNGGCSPTILN